MKGFCSICPECNGKVCAGKVPGMGGCGSGFSFQHNYMSLKELHLQMRCLHQVKDPQTTVEIFGQNLSMPILGAPITGTKFNFGGYVTQEEFCDDIIDRKSTRLNSSHANISYAVFCLKKKK